MKRIFALVLCAAILLSTPILPLPASAAEEFTEGCYTYTVTDGEATITAFDKSIFGSIAIPATLGGYPVTTIDDYAFSYCYDLTSITIPDSVTTIGAGAFSGCTSLTGIWVQEENPYYSSDEGGVLFDKDKTQLLQAPGRLSGSYAIPDSVTTIGYSAFEWCTSLTSITIPDGVTTIGDSAFYGCESLISVTIPDSVTTIGDGAFQICSSLTQIVVEEDNQYYSNDGYGVLFNKDKTELLRAPGRLSGSYAVPDSVTTIGDFAFCWCDSLTSVTIGNGVTIIGAGAFTSCTNLTDVTIGNGVTTIGNDAFYGCDSLTDVTIGNGVTTIGYDAFYDCYSLTYNVYDNGNYLGNGKNPYVALISPINESITTCNIHTDTKIIADWALGWCDSLTGITISDSVTTIGNDAFRGCDSLTGIWVEEGNPSYSSDESGVLFNKNKTLLLQAPCGLPGSYAIPVSVTTISDCAFDGCTSLTSVTIPDGVTTIGKWAFFSCTHLTDVYYNGTEGEWDAITIDDYHNEPLLNATLHFADADALVIDTAGNEYTSLADAVDAVTAGSKLTLMADIAEDVVIDKDIVLDLNGHNITGTITVSDGCTLYAMDSQTDDYTVEDDFGYGKLTDVVGNVVGLPEESDAAQDGYLMITEDDGISFHRVNLQISAMSLRASVAGVYFKSDFAADEVVAPLVKSFGVALSIKAMPNASNMSSCQYSTFKNFTAGENKDATSTLLKGIMKENNAYLINKVNANTEVYGRAYIQLADGSYIFGAGVQRSLRQQVEMIDATWASLSADQKASVLEMYNTYTSVMKSWEIPNIIAAA